MTDPEPASKVSDTEVGGSAPADWYPDPNGRFELRYFNGSAWTADVATAGQRLVDPNPWHEVDTSAGRGGSRDRLGGISMAAGIVAIAFGWIPFVVVVGAIAAVVAIVSGLVVRHRGGAAGGRDPRAAVGLLTGVIGLLACGAGAVLTVTVLDALDRYQHPAAHTAEITACSEVGGLATAALAVTSVERGGGPADFTVEVLFLRRDTDAVVRTSRVEIDDVPAGGSKSAETTRRVSDSGSAGPGIECRVGEVNGPYPFGLDLGW